VGKRPAQTDGRTRAECAVVDRTPNLQEEIGASSRPPHLLRFVHPPIDQEVGGAFRHRGAYSQACTIAFGVVDEPGALAAKIGVERVQRVPQFAGSHASRPMTPLAPEDVHDLAEPLEREQGISGLAVPDPPMQALDLRDDGCLRRNPTWLVGGQAARRLLRMLQPHGNVEPVRDRRRGDAGLGQNRTQSATTIGERRQCGVGGSADRLEISLDERRDVSVRIRDRAEYLPGATGCLGIANANLQMALAMVAATDEGRVQGDGDRRRCNRRRDGLGVAELLADSERVAAQGLGTLPSLHRQKVHQYACGDTIRHQCGEMCSQLVRSGVDRQCGGQLTLASL
jgi:hypothetical protein